MALTPYHWSRADMTVDVAAAWRSGYPNHAARPTARQPLLKRLSGLVVLDTAEQSLCRVSGDLAGDTARLRNLTIDGPSPTPQQPYADVRVALNDRSAPSGQRQARVPQRHDLIVVVLFALRIAHVSPQVSAS